MDENLVGYLLKSLDPVTQARVEAHVSQHPEEQAKLAILRRALTSLADDDFAPPPGLTLATLARVAEHHCALPPAPAVSVNERAGGGRGWFGRIEWVVAASLLLLVGGLGATALVGQLRAAQRVACENNLRRFHADLSVFADGNHGDFPQVPAQGPLAFAGAFVPLLVDQGLLCEASVGCPATGKHAVVRCTVDELIALSRDDPKRYEAIVSQVAGNYAYTLGYDQNGKLHGLTRTTGDLLPLMADNAGRSDNSDNHGGAGQNVLYVGGNVRWCVQPTVGVGNDHIYVNKRNQVSAGVSRVDTVLGASDARPYLSY